MSNALHYQLREATRGQHERLHGLMELDLLLHSGQTYSTALLAYWRAIWPLEQTLSHLFRTLGNRSQSTQLPPDAEQRVVKAAWLRSDLVAIGSSQERGELDRDVLDPDFAPALDVVRQIQLELDSSDENRSTATVAGFSYVLEGMTLGAAQMLPRVTGSLGYTADSGAKFFAAYGSTTREMWNRLTNWLNAIAVSDEHVLHAAQYCFRRFEQELGLWNRSVTILLKDPSSHA